MKIKSLLAGAAFLSVASFANAGVINSANGLLQLDDDTFIPVASNNNLVNGTYNIGGNLSATGSVNLKFTYLGHEAGYNNDFNAYSGNLNNKSNSINDSFSVSGVLAGLLDFNFYSNGAGAGVTNGSNQPFASPQSFAVMFDYTYSGTFYDAVILFDDSGAGPDDNHDDHVIGVNATITEPMTLALMGLGLAGLGAARRRKA